MLRVSRTPMAAVGEGDAPRSWHVWKAELMGVRVDWTGVAGEGGAEDAARAPELALDSMESSVLCGDVESTLKSDLKHSQAGLPALEASWSYSFIPSPDELPAGSVPVRMETLFANNSHS